MSELYVELKERFKAVNCEHKTQHEFSFEKFPHCKFREFERAKKAAVLLLLFRTKHVFNNELCVLFTIRSLQLRSFPGEICYPGGKFDFKLDTTYEDTALREAYEEIDLKREHVSVICKLCPCVTPVGHYIVPIVGLLEDSRGKLDPIEILKGLKANKNEVELIFWVPLRYIADALKSNELFNQHIMQMDYKKINLENRQKRLPEFSVRNLFEINEQYFENELNRMAEITPINKFLYGINAQLAILIALLCVDDSEFECKIKGKVNRTNISNYISYTTLASYLFFKMNNAEKLAANKQKKQNAAKAKL